MIVDDELNMRRVLSALLRKEGYQVIPAANGKEALDFLGSKEVSVLITDLKMPGMDGIELLEKVNSRWPHIPVIMLTAHGTISNAVEALKKGAFDYLTKPFEQEELKLVVEKAVKIEKLNSQDIRSVQEDLDQCEIIGKSQIMQEIYQTIEKVASSPTTILLTGESGTGKELITRAIHKKSGRNGPFIKINCAAIPSALMESELFGYEKGAFTGAVTSKPGRFELADHGTLFLDEIGEIPKEMQVKFLHVLQEREIERVGGLKTIKIDVRLIIATKKDLAQEVQLGNFRDDLYYRLNVMPIHLLPLRERREDIPPLLDYFRERFNKHLNREVRGIEEEARQILVNYDWPGNIRELENVMERLVLMAEGSMIRMEDLPEEIKLGAEKIGDSGEDKEKSFKGAVKAKAALVERELIEKVLKDVDGNVTRSSRMLGISRRSLQIKMKRYGLKRKRDGG
jgi:DNA-binding NtrC family response regulator